MTPRRTFSPHARGIAPLAIVASIALTSSVHGDSPRVAYRVDSYDVATLEAAARAGKPFTMRILGVDRVLELSPSRLRAQRFEVSTIGARSAPSVAKAADRCYKGQVDGDPESVVRLAFTRAGLRGFIATEGGRVFIEPASTAAAARGAKRVRHKLSTDADTDPGYIAGCAALGTSASTGGASGNVSAESHDEPLAAAAELRSVEVFVVADYELSERYGDGISEFVESVINGASGIFASELGVELTLAGIRVWSTPADPFTQSDATLLLDELRTLWRANEAETARDTVHLLTGRGLDGGIVGYAGVGVICSDRWGYGLSEDLGSLGWTTLVVAHELGHNLGAGHDPSGSNFLMAPSLGSNTLRQLSASSRSEIDAHLANAACVESHAEPQLPPPPRDDGRFVRGDVNGDGDVDMTDAIATVDWLFRGGRASDCFDAVDANDDGRIDLADAFRVINHLLRGAAAPSAPYPVAGLDTTADTLPPCGV